MGEVAGKYEFTGMAGESKDIPLGQTDYVLTVVLNTTEKGEIIPVFKLSTKQIASPRVTDEVAPALEKREEQPKEESKAVVEDPELTQLREAFMDSNTQGQEALEAWVKYFNHRFFGRFSFNKNNLPVLFKNAPKLSDEERKIELGLWNIAWEKLATLDEFKYQGLLGYQQNIIIGIISPSLEQVPVQETKEPLSEEKKLYEEYLALYDEYQAKKNDPEQRLNAIKAVLNFVKKISGAEYQAEKVELVLSGSVYFKDSAAGRSSNVDIKDLIKKHINKPSR